MLVTRYFTGADSTIQIDRPRAVEAVTSASARALQRWSFVCHIALRVSDNEECARRARQTNDWSGGQAMLVV